MHKYLFDELKPHLQSGKIVCKPLHSRRQLLVLFDGFFPFYGNYCYGRTGPNNWCVIKLAINKSIAKYPSFSVDKYFLVLRRTCSLKLARRQRFSMCSLNFKLLSSQ